MTPYFLIDADKIEQNLKVLHGVMERTGCSILLAQKCFSCYALYPLIGKYLSGATASGLFEARLCHEEMLGKQNHVFSPAFREGLQVGLRINPECSTQEGHAIYDPCAPGSRLGTTIEVFDAMPQEDFDLLDGLHFHTLCEQNSDDLETTLNAVEERFGKYLPRMKWINFGGGHHITRADYDIPRLERLITHMSRQYGLHVILEPGEAVALNAGTLHTTVLEIQQKGADGISNVILDTSAACHMPDVIEMPYLPPLIEPEGHNVYRFGGPTCLSGDVIGVYSIERELHEGDELVFGDMAIYSMVKTNTFNGMPLPDIYIRKNGIVELWKHFDYSDFKCRV